jgi:hypothetical protein
MVWYIESNRTHVIHKVDTKLNDLLFLISLSDASFRTGMIANILLKISINLSKRNMLCKYTGPRIKISSTRWTRRWVMILKNEGGKIISKLTRHCTTSYYIFTRVCGRIAFWEIWLRNAHTLVIVNLTFSGRIPLSGTGSSCVINMWQSRAFKFKNFFSLIFITLYIWGVARWDLHTIQAIKYYLLLFLA